MKRIVPLSVSIKLTLAVACASMQAQTPATVNSEKVNVRGRPTIFSEVITQLHAGEKVKVLEEVKLEKTKLGDPAIWAKIAMPENTPLWVSSSMVDADSKSVKVRKLNVRAGPSENFSIVGVLPKDAVVKEIRVVGDWMEIETPEDAYAYVAMEYLDKEVPAKAEAVATPPAEPETPVVTAPAAEETKSAPAVVKEEPKPAQPSAQPETVTPPPVTPPAPEPVTPAKTEPVPAAVEATPPPPPPATGVTAPTVVTKRIVRREGVVKSTVSIQAPSHYELASVDNGKVMNYIHPITPDIDVKGFKGRRVVVTGEEMLDPRWPKTPVIVIESIELAP